MADALLQAPRTPVDRAWLAQQLQPPRLDPERLVDILHARYCTDPPASHLLLARTLAVAPEEIARREAAALRRLRDAAAGAELPPATRLAQALAALPPPAAAEPAPRAVAVAVVPEPAAPPERKGRGR